MVYVITGGPGFGKTVLIEKLRNLGYQIGEETARRIIFQQIECQGDILPWKNVSKFEKLVTQERIDFLNRVEIQDIAFSDRGLPDQAGFSLFKGKPISMELTSAISMNRYAKKVFVTPPWFQIYMNDPIRTETFEEAEKIHHFIMKAYVDNGYELIDLPLTTPDKRIDFIINSL
ncbi:MAG: AAA family ATPase [Mariniphaga sp.]